MAAPCPGWVTTEVSNSTLTGGGGANRGRARVPPLPPSTVCLTQLL